jgi:transcriptional regulator with XRE-family HTH domain
LTGCAQSTLSRVEAGTQVPTPAMLAKLSTSLGLDLRELYEMSGYEQPIELPELRSYMRMKYKDLPPRAFVEIEDFVDFLRQRYGVVDAGPEPRSDESPDGERLFRPRESA